MNTPQPTKKDVSTLVLAAFGENPVSINRFPTGLAHYVYDIQMPDNWRIVARLARLENREELNGGVFWTKILRPLGIPLPEIYFHDLQARLTPYPAMLIERFPGTDLWHVYPEFTFEHKRGLANEIVNIQDRVGQMPEGLGFGYVAQCAAKYPFQTWQEVIEDSLELSRKRITDIGIFDPRQVDRVQEYLPQYYSYLDGIPPRMFLDDTTTKNVIVDKGKLSGIIDVDTVCYGDSLYAVALTRMSLLNLGYDLDYITCWCDRMHLRTEQYAALDFYTAVFCVIFMSEIGQHFNKDHPQGYNPQTIRSLNLHLNRLLASF